MNRVVAITGASAGVGRATARMFAEQGADVALIARGRDGLEAAAREIEALGRRALVIPCDVADANAVLAAAEQIERDLGPIDVWVNNAMVSVFAPIIDTTPEEFRRVTEVTYLGYVHGTLAALRVMRPRDRGTIVQVGSALAARSIPLQSAYCAAKHAVTGFTESLRSELLHDKSNVHVTEVQLPAINTPQFGWSRAKLPNKPQPVPPIYQPEVAAKAIVYAAAHRRRQLWVGFPVVKAMVGEKVAPAIADRYLASRGYDGQQTDEPIGERRDNLYEPLPGDAGAHGTFSSRAKKQSLQLFLNLNRGPLLAVGLGLLAGSAIAYAARR
jgi:NAD(P)-dependent dehydrogenase (short-subunit alcohol dehydrogenase family)